MIIPWFRRPDPPAPAPVVLFHTSWTKLDDGWSIASRASARAMALGGLDVHLLAWDTNGSLEPPRHPDVNAEVGAMARDIDRWDLHLFSAPLTSYRHMHPLLVNLLGEREPQSLHSMFERQHIEPELVADLNKFPLWAQCQANRDVLVAAGVKKVAWIPFPYFPDDPYLALPTPREPRRMLWVGRDEPRKEPGKLIQAFLKAFRPGEAELTLKLSPYRHTAPRPELEGYAVGAIGRNGWTGTNLWDSIKIVRSRLSKAEMLALHARHDVYVSASRGEGLDLPAFSAKLAGRMLVMTDSGGVRDFVGEGDILVPQKGTVPADRSYSWGPGATYGDYDWDELVAGLQKARGGKVVGSRVPEHHRAAKVGRVFREWVG